jgi:hypothetical protein
LLCCRGGNCVYAPPLGGIPGPRLETGDYFEESYTSTVELYARPYDAATECTVVPEPEPEPEPEPPTREPLSAFEAEAAGALVGHNLRISESGFVQVADVRAQPHSPPAIACVDIHGVFSSSCFLLKNSVVACIVLLHRRRSVRRAACWLAQSANRSTTVVPDRAVISIVRPNSTATSYPILPFACINQFSS